MRTVKEAMVPCPHYSNEIWEFYVNEDHSIYYVYFNKVFNYKVKREKLAWVATNTNDEIVIASHMRDNVFKAIKDNPFYCSDFYTGV